MSSTQRPLSVTRADFRHHRGWAVGAGIALVLLGLAAIVFPFLASLAVEQLVGWILVMSGFVGLLNALRQSAEHGFGLSLLAALLSLGIGIVLVLYPLSGILSLTLLVATLLVGGGLLRIFLAWRLRHTRGYRLTLASGLLGVGLGAVIIVQWPQAAAWLIGVLVGIDLVFAGLVSLALAAEREPR